MTESAKTSKAVKKEILNKYPNLQIRYKSENFTGGSASNIYVMVDDIKDIVTIDELRKITNKYEYGHFDGMTDYYDIDNSRDDIPQVKYLHLDIEYSKKVADEIAKKFNEYWSNDDTLSAYVIESDSYNFKDVKVGYIRSDHESGYYWIQEYIKKHL